MSKKKKEVNPFIAAFKKLPPNATPQQVEQVIKDILNKHGLPVNAVSITTRRGN